MPEYFGWWSTYAPLSPEQVKADRELLVAIVIPDPVIMREATVYVNGHEWQYRSERISVIGED